MEDMRLGGPQMQLIYFLKQIIKTKYFNKYYLILPIGSKKVLSKYLKISKFKVEEVELQYLSKKYIFKYALSFFKESLILKKKLHLFEKVYLPGGTSNLKSLFISIFLKKKIFFHIHDIKLNKFSKFLIYLVSKKVEKVFFASKRSKNYYKNIFKNSKKILLRSSVYLPEKKIKKKECDNLHVGMIANINPDKNIELLIKIVKKIESKKIKFHLIGNLWDTQINYFKNSLNSFEDVKKKMMWYRNIYKPEQIMSKFDILICTSKYESLPLSIIEALSLGIPVISSDVGDIKKVINKKKLKCGYIINNTDPEKFINRINFYMKNKLMMRKHSINAKKNVIDNFSIKNYADRINECIFK